ncbi:MAG: hypothetical protein MJZ65_02565 [Paludibacteraceae bacterium]|nr:hypothetical protein [Paludibacteraceae bacterium]
MKHVCKLLTLCTVLMFVVTGCKEGEVEDPETMLVGYWQRTNTNQYVRFMHDDGEMRDGYYLGYEWDEDDEVYEDDLWNYMYHGNSWFEWYTTVDNKDNKLTQIHLMDNGGADIPRIYTITTLTETTLSFTDGFDTRNYVKIAKPQL